MKLRHEKFGSYPGTCWRLLFIFALMPWMRKFRLNPDNIEISSFKFAAMRMWSGRMPKEMPNSNEGVNSAVNATISDENIDLKQSNSAMQKEISKLKKDNDLLRQEVLRLKELAASSRKKQFSMSMPNATNPQQLYS